MIVIHDYTQLIKTTQRRLTATWHERRGTSVDIVPRIAREAATGVCDDNHWMRQNLT